MRKKKRSVALYIYSYFNFHVSSQWVNVHQIELVCLKGLIHKSIATSVLLYILYSSKP